MISHTQRKLLNNTVNGHYGGSQQIPGLKNMAKALNSIVEGSTQKNRDGGGPAMGAQMIMPPNNSKTLVTASGGVSTQSASLIIVC